MNAKQRKSNRANAYMLKSISRKKELSIVVCENCGEFGGHWVSIRGTSIFSMIHGLDDQEGFWTCSKLYREDGRRLSGGLNAKIKQTNDT